MADKSRPSDQEDMMQETPRQRIRTLQELGQVRPQVADFAEEALSLVEESLTGPAAAEVAHNGTARDEAAQRDFAPHTGRGYGEPGNDARAALSGEAGILLVTHLSLALEHSLKGESIGVDPAPIEEELKGRDEAVALAGEIAKRAQERLGVTLPRSELLFMALHLAALAGAEQPS